MKLEPKARPSWSALGAWMVGCWALLALAGCSSGLEGVDKRLSSMQDEITKLQGQNDHLIERMDAVEVRQAKAESSGASPAKPGSASGATSTVSERPNLKVVKVVPEDSSGMPSPQVGSPAPGDAADDPSPRPVIKLRGPAGKGDAKGDTKGES